MTHDSEPIPSAAEIIGDGIDDLFPVPVVEIGKRWPIVRTGRRAIISRDLRRLVWHRDGGRCQICGAGQVPVQLDHIVPWSAGGPDRSANLRLLCGPCNKARSNYRSSHDLPKPPVTLGCDTCIRGWVRNYGFTHFGRIVLDNPEITAYCGSCRQLSPVTDPTRLL